MRKTTIVGLACAGLVIISTFLPMLSVSGASAGLFDSEDGKSVAILIIALALIMGLFSFLANKKHLASIGTFLIAGILALISLKWFGDATTLGVSYGMGLILYLIGSIGGLVSAVMGFLKK